MTGQLSVESDMQMLKWLTDKVLASYKKNDEEEKSKIKIFFYSNLFIIFFAVLTTALYALYLPERMQYGLPIFASGFIFSIINIFLIASGKFKWAVLFFAYSITLILIYMQMQKTGTSMHTGYNSYFYLLLANLISVTFFTERLTLLIITAITIGADIVYFSLVYPHVQENKLLLESITSGFLSTMFSLLLSGGMLYMLKGVLEKSLATAKDQSQEAGAQYQRIRKIMSSSDLFDSVEQSSSTLLKAGTHVRTLVTDTNDELISVSIQADKNLEQIHNIGRLAKRQSDEIGRVNQHLGKLAQHMQLASQSSEQYAQSVNETLKSSQKGSDMILLTTQAADKVTTNTVHISELTGNIRGIAEKVNMLSLNASIEASRAGEAGKGFSVVAEEISKLAERTSESAGEISALVKEELSSVQEVSSFISKLAESFKEISRSIAQINKYISVIHNVTVDGSNISEQAEKLMENILVESQQIENSMSLQITSNETIQKRIQSITDDMQKVSQSFVGLIELSRNLNQKSGDLKAEVLGK